MRRSIVRLIVLIVALGLLMSGMAFADPDPAPPSNTADISGGIFKEANDQFLSVTDFRDLESHVVFLQFDMPSAALGQGFQIGGSADLFGMYVGAYLNSMMQGINGLLVGNVSQTITIDDDFLVDGTGVITGKTEATAVRVDYDLNSMTDLQALVGIGTMGAGLRVYHDVSNGRGSYVPTFTFPGTPTWNAIGVTTVTVPANTLSTTDAVGALVSLNGEAYGLGKDNTGQLDFTASFGMPLAISDTMDLDVGGDLLFGLRDDDASAEYEAYTRVVGSGTAISYTPLQALDGADPLVIDDLTSYTFSEAVAGDSHMEIAPSVFANVTMPLKEMITATGGVSLGVSMPLYGAKYNDNAGVQQRVGGLADSFYSIDVLPEINAADPTLIQTTTTTTRGWQTEDISMLTIDLDLSSGVEIVPNERFRFGVAAMPMISYSSASSTFAGQATETVVVDNGDGADGVDDSVVRSTVDRSGYNETTRTFTMSNRVNTAAQFFLIPERLRVNLGAQVDTVLIDRSLSETVTNGIVERTVQSAVDTTDTAATTFVVTDYQFDTDVRAATDDSQIVTDAGSSSLVYDAGLTFFFDESMFLDLRMDATGGDIWSTNEWSLEMTILY